MKPCLFSDLLGPGLLALALVACSGNGGAMSVVGPKPEVVDEDRSEGLRGVDADGNGIRDDIDRLIAAKFSPASEVRKAAEQKARALQQMLEAGTREEGLVAGGKLLRSTSCVFQVLPSAIQGNERLRITLLREIESLTANTRERLVKYIDSNRLVGGGYFSQSPEPVCD